MVVGGVGCGCLRYEKYKREVVVFCWKKEWKVVVDVQCSIGEGQDGKGYVVMVVQWWCSIWLSWMGRLIFGYLIESL